MILMLVCYLVAVGSIAPVADYPWLALLADRLAWLAVTDLVAIVG